MRSIGPIVVGALVAAGASPASAAETCHKINAKGVGQITSQTPSGATTVSRIIGGGLLHGTTEAELEFTSLDPATGAATFVGTFTLTTRHGVLQMLVLESDFNLVTGEFSSPIQVVGGTGRFESATGSLFLHGFSAPDGSFVDDVISGEVCLTLP